MRLKSKIVGVVLISLIILSAIYGGGWRVGTKYIFLILFGGLGIISTILVKKKYDLPTLITYAAVLFLGYSIFSIFHSVSPDSSIEKFLFYLGYLFIFILIFNLVRRDEILGYLRLFFVLNLIIVGIGYYYFILEKMGNVKATINMSEFFIGTFYWKNPMAGYLGLILPVSLGLSLIESKWWRVFYGVNTILLGCAFLFTKSRGAWVAMILPLIVWLILVVKRVDLKKNLQIAGIIIIILVVSLSIFPPGKIANRVSSLKEVTKSPKRQERSFSERIIMYKMAWEVTKDHPILGVGLNAYGAVYPMYLKSSHYVSRFVHNQYLQIMAETGFLGLLFWLFLLLGLVVWPLFWIFNANKQRVILGISMIGGCGFLLLHIGVDFDWTFPAIVYTFFLMSAFAFKLTDLDRQVKVPRLLLGIIGAVLVLFSLTRDYSNRFYARAQAARGNDNLRAALAEAKKATYLNPFRSSHWSQRAKVHFFQGDYKKSKKYIHKAIKLEPYSSDAYFLLSKIFLRRNKLNKAIKKLEKSVDLAPYSRPGFMNKLGELYLQRGDTALAREIFRKVTNRFSTTPGGKYNRSTVDTRYKVGEACISLARILRREGKKKEAQKFFKKGGKLGQPREEDRIASQLGKFVKAPEFVVAQFWQAVSEDNLTRINNYLNKKQNKIEIPENVSFEVLRILKLDYSYASRKSSIEYLLERTRAVPKGRDKVDTLRKSAELILEEDGWKLKFQ